MNENTGYEGHRHDPRFTIKEYARRRMISNTEQGMRIIDLERRVTDLSRALDVMTDHVRLLLVRVGALEQQVNPICRDSNTVRKEQNE